MKDRMKSEDFILPITAVIETGNFIAQLNDGNVRRATAVRFAGILGLVSEGKTPWILHDFKWGAEFLADLVAGAGTGTDYAGLAMQGVGAGDLCILTERRLFERRTRIKASVWSLDEGLSAHGPG